LLNLGLVHKENFDEGSDSDGEFAVRNYMKQKEENPAILEKQERERTMKEESAKAFEDWLSLKGLREQALKYLAMIPTPSVSAAGNNNSCGNGNEAWGERGRERGGAGGGAGGSKMSTRRSGTMPLQEDEGIKHLIEVRSERTD
jgi:hypothetical protein